MNFPLDNPFAPPEADIGPPRPDLDPQPGESDVPPEPGDGFVSKLIFRWEAYRLLYDAALGLICWGLWCLDGPRFRQGPVGFILLLSALGLNIAFTFGPMLTCAFESSRWLRLQAPAYLAAVGLALALASIAWELAA